MGNEVNPNFRQQGTGMQAGGSMEGFERLGSSSITCPDPGFHTSTVRGAVAIFV